MDSPIEHAPLKVQPPLVFLAYLVGALLLNLLLPLPEPWGSILRIVGALGVLAGFGLGASAVSAMFKARTSPDPHRPTMALVTDGPYRFTRNPIYLGFYLVFLGFTLLAGTLWGLVLSPLLIWTVTAIIIRVEEAYLASRFADRYAVYTARARRWI